MTHLRSATELAHAFASGAETAESIITDHLAAIAALNPALNAMIAPRTAHALEEGRAADAARTAGAPPRPLDGVPVTIKDSLDLAGFASTFGLPSRAHILAEQDEPHVARLRAAGAIVLGKTNAAQMLLAHETDNPLFGRSNHPHNPARTPGGSSGGEAAIIASGGSAMGLGSDIAGSVRIPAAFCGIAAIKPTTGRLPDRGRFSAHPGQQAVPSQVGIMARTVADVALGLTVANGDRDPDRLPPAPLFDWQSVDVAALRIGWFDDDTILAPSSPVRRALHEAVAVLARRGAKVVRWQPPDPRHAADIFVSILAADGAQSLARVRGRNPLTPGLRAFYTLMRLPRPVLRMLQAFGPLGGRDTLAEMTLPNIGHRDTLRYWDMVAARDTYAEKLMASLDTTEVGRLDVVLSPPYPLPALPHGTAGNFGFGGIYAVLWNLLGFPAGVVPFGEVGATEEPTKRDPRDRMQKAATKAEAGCAGLPLSVQVAARPWREDQVLAVMSALETRQLERIGP
jgi:fatty acid amide hydrolase